VSKTNKGHFFEDFAVGQVIDHATPRSVSAGDQALYTALYGSRFALQSSEAFACSLGLPGAPIDDLLVFHIVFGKTVPDISLNAVANLGYADGVFGVPVYPGDTLNARSEVIGVKENSNGKTGTVYVRSTGANQRGETVLSYVRWVMVRKRDPGAPAPTPVLPELPDGADPEGFVFPDGFSAAGFDPVASGSPHYWEDYEEGEEIDHVDAMTIEEAEHQMATRLYQNTAKVHFNLHSEKQGRFGKRIVYGGHVISTARAISFNGLGNAVKLLAINGGAHTAPAFAGDTIYAWSRVLERTALPGRNDIGALRLRTIATKDEDCAAFPLKGDDGRYHPAVVLDLDYTALVPRRR
jgi:2-methylfumaryl-CoA hydratase